MDQPRHTIPGKSQLTKKSTKPEFYFALLSIKTMGTEITARLLKPIEKENE